MTMTPAKIVSTLKKSAYGRSSLVYWINRHDTDLATLCRHTLQNVALADRAFKKATVQAFSSPPLDGSTKVADGVVDTESWGKFLKLGGKYAQKLCAGDVKSDGYTATISVRAAEKSYTEAHRRLLQGVLLGKSAVSDGHIAFTCEKPPPYELFEDMNSIVGNLWDASTVDIAYVPSFKEFDKSKLISSDDKNLVLLSDETGLNPVLLAAVVAAVGAPYTIRHEITKYESGRKKKKTTINRLGPVFVSGPNGVGMVMPMRRAVHEKENPARPRQMEFQFNR